MAVIFLSVLEARLPFEVLARLSPLLPIPLVLGLERLVLTKYELSGVSLLGFRLAYLLAILLAVLATFVLGIETWE